MDTLSIPLTKGKTAIIDEADASLVAPYTWYATFNKGHWYATAYDPVSRKKIYMHRLITGAPRGRVVDHKDNDGLNNRRGNLRVCRHAQNIAAGQWARGRSGYIGVNYESRLISRPYKATLCANGRAIQLGRYATAEEAARVRDRAAIRYHGEFARLNFPKLLREYELLCDELDGTTAAREQAALL